MTLSQQQTLAKTNDLMERIICAVNGQIHANIVPKYNETTEQAELRTAAEKLLKYARVPAAPTVSWVQIAAGVFAAACAAIDDAIAAGGNMAPWYTVNEHGVIEVQDAAVKGWVANRFVFFSTVVPA
jgi:hypothetical protein